MRAGKVIMIFAALLPIFTHSILLIIAYLEYDFVPSGKPDLAVFIACLFYVLVVIIISKRREYLIRMLLFTYSFIFSITLAYFIFMLYAPMNFPWIPRHTVGYASDSMPGISGAIELSINRYGIRGPESDISKADIKILVVGGSAVECYYVTDKLSWPWRLQDKLSQGLAKNVFVGNAGKSENTTFHHIYMLKNYRWAPRFDWIVVMCGINDINISSNKDFEDRLKIDIPQRTFNLVINPATVYYRKSLLSLLYYLIFKKYLPEEAVQQDPYGLWYEKVREQRKMASNTIIDRMPPRLEEGLRIYKDNLREIISICRSREQNILMLTQPTIYKKDLPARLQDLIWGGLRKDGAYFSLDVQEKVMRAYNLAMMEVCKEQKLICIDIDSMLPKDDSVFYDDCHFNIEGCEKVSEIIAKEMINWYNTKDNK